jgi:hypothetical protein
MMIVKSSLHCVVCANKCIQCVKNGGVSILIKEVITINKSASKLQTPIYYLYTFVLKESTTFAERV